MNTDFGGLKRISKRFFNKNHIRLNPLNPRFSASYFFNSKNND